ncbi:MAG: TlpA family protein disulfide reductase [Candidatus Eremiobacteraeota bacterium]|nr:TlpA family protein disulfide reductase [Candidatus Eremiobacteraeota bacterium]
MTARVRKLLGVTAVAALISLCLSGPALTAAAPRPGTQAPSFSAPLAANGNGSVTDAGLKGHGIYLNFFASWCGPCKAEAPFIGRLSREFARRRVVVVGVDELERAQQAKNFAVQYRLPYRIALDSNGDIGSAYGLIGLPLHVFIGPDGKVVAVRTGELNERQVTDYMRRISSR